jgi:hypothetical protein
MTACFCSGVKPCRADAASIIIRFEKDSPREVDLSAVEPKEWWEKKCGLEVAGKADSPRSKKGKIGKM